MTIAVNAVDRCSGEEQVRDYLDKLDILKSMWPDVIHPKALEELA